MNTLKKLFGGASIMALLAFAACTSEPDEARYAQLATVTSDNPAFVADATGGTVSFGTEGNTVVISVDCGTTWEAVNDSPDWLEANVNVNAGTLTLIAGQNTEAKERTATVVLQTSASGVKIATINITQTAYDAPTISIGTAEWHAPAVGALSTTITIDASEDWTAEVGAGTDWLTAEKDGNSLKLTASENEDTAERTAEVVVTCTDGVETPSQTITVTQDGKAYITLSDYAVSIASAGASESVTVETNFDWSYSCEGSWLSVSGSGSTLTLSASENETDDAREATVTITAGDGAENIAEATIAVTQGVVSKTLVLVYTITADDTSVQLPLYDTVDCTVDWGDGSTETVTSTLPSHTYAAGQYEVQVKGTVTAIKSYVSSTAITGSTLLTAVTNWGKTGLTDLSYAFYNCTGLKSLPTDADGALAEVTNLSYFCYGATALESLSSNTFGSCPNVTACTNIFQKCTSLTEVPAGLFNGLTACTDFTSAFYSCSNLTTIPSGLFDYCTKVTTLTGLFRDCSSLQAIPDKLFDSWTEVNTFTSVFYGCSSLTSVPAGLFANSTNCTSFASAFRGCSKLASVPEGLFAGFSQNANCSYTFYGCSSLVSVPGGLFKDNVLCINFTYTFQNCTSLEELPGDLFAGCTGITSLASTFRGCTALKTINSGIFDGCTLISNVSNTFNGCTALTTVPTSIFDSMTGITNFSNCFSGCSAWVGESPYTEITEDGQTVAVHLYERADHTASFSKPTSTSGCFKSCTQLTDYSSIPSGWGGN